MPLKYTVEPCLSGTQSTGVSIIRRCPQIQFFFATQQPVLWMLFFVCCCCFFCTQTMSERNVDTCSHLFMCTMSANMECAFEIRTTRYKIPRNFTRCFAFEICFFLLVFYVLTMFTRIDIESTFFRRLFYTKC